jgi:SAM-dependent methyltransferase
MTNPAVTGAPAPVSYSLPKTNAKVLALLESHLAHAGHVLDIGAGEGYLARRVHDLIRSKGYAAKLEACDLFPDNFRVPEVPCHAINLHGGLPLADQSVDLAYSVEVLEHLEDQFLFFREVHRVLRPGGRFVLTTPNVLSLTSRVRTLLAGFPELFGPLPIHGYDPQHVGGHIHPVSVYYISYMAEKAGFRVTGCSTDRVKSGSVALLVLWPLVKLGSAIVAMHARRKTPAIHAENREHLERMNSLAVLTGRTVIVEMERRW